MNLLISIQYQGILFRSFLLIAVITTLVMGYLSKNFKTLLKGCEQNFNILDLEFPKNNKSVPTIIQGIYQLDANKAMLTTSSLRKSLYVDYLFMIGIFGAIFILCNILTISFKPGTFAFTFFTIIGLLQVIALVCDACEDIFILSWIREDIPNEIPIGTHNSYIIIVWTKWVIASVGGISSVVMWAYFWFKK